MNAPVHHHHRPFPSGLGCKNNEKQGRILLDLLRSRDKLAKRTTSDDTNTNNNNAARPGVAADDDDDDDDVLDRNNNNEPEDCCERRLIARLRSLNASVRRCGLFSDSERAREYHACASARSSSSAASADATNNAAAEGGGGGGSKKRKRKKGGGAGGGNNGSSAGLSAASYGIYLDSSNSNNAELSSSNSAGENHDLDEGLVLTAVCRILGATVGRKKKSGVIDASSSSSSSSTATASSSYGLTCAALDVLSSLCDHAKDGTIPLMVGDATGASVEGEMIGSVGPALLDALCDAILYMYYRSREEGPASNGLIGCFKSCASVVSLLETRLSRADKTIKSLKETAWLVLNDIDGLAGARDELVAVVKAGTALLATLPLAGSSEGIPPSKLRSNSVAEGIALLRWAMTGFFPLPADGKGGANPSDAVAAEARRLPGLWKEHEAWLSVAEKPSEENDEEIDLGNDPTDEHRSKALKSRIQCLASFVRSLLTMEGHPLHRSSALSLPLDSLLDASEILLSFPLLAEAKHRSTKSRLRSSPVKDGMISPNAALAIAAEARVCGHGLLNATVESCRGGAGALSRARRLVGMSVANLQSSSSYALVSVVVDGRRNGGSIGSNGGGGDNKRMGSWLRGSIPLRIKSIETFHSTMLSLGSGVMSSTGTAKSVCRALVLVAGCLLEQANGGGGVGAGDEWGTLGERAKLVETSSNALASCIALFGGLVPNDVRSTLDSVIHTCLSTLYSAGGASIFAYSRVKRSVLQLGTNCACVPWGDGGRSTMTEIVRRVANVQRNDGDLGAASAAQSALCVMDAFATPRAPPLLIPARGALNDATAAAAAGSGMTASALLRGMNESKMEISNEAKEEQKKASKKSGKKPRNKKAKKEAAVAKVEKQSPPVESNGGSAEKKSKKTKEASTVADESPAAYGIERLTVPINAGKVPSKLVKSDSKKKKQKSPAAERTDTKKASKNNSAGDNVADKPMLDGNDEMQDGSNVDKAQDPMDTSDAADDETMKSKEEDNANSDDGSDSGLDDFPDIVDEDPDEEDRL